MQTTFPTPNWENISILIVEDDLINYKFLEMTLKRTKANILWAQNGEEGVNIFKSEKVDIILMDIQMPIMNGYEATRLIKEMDESIPIIAQSAFALNNEEEKCLEAGCNIFLNKPLNPTELMKHISSFLG